MPADHPAAGDEPRTWHVARPPLYHLVYCSRAAAGVDAAVVDQIVATAQRMNPRHGITGLLVFGGGVFFQWLEGPRSSVLQLMAQLRADKRHTDVTEITSSEEVRERLFPDWAMERVGPEHVREVLQDAHDSATEAPSKAVLGRLLADLDAGALVAPGWPAG